MRFLDRSTPGLLAILVLAATAIAAEERAASSNDAATKQNAEVHAFLGKYCVGCHNPEKRKGKLDLTGVAARNLDLGTKEWRKIARQLRSREMPPEDEPRPDEKTYDEIVSAIDGLLSARTTSDDSESIESDATQRGSWITKSCAHCHDAETKEAGLDLESIATLPARKHPRVWENVIRKLAARQMPPAGEPRPDPKSVGAVVTALARELDAAAAEHPNPGRTDSFRRLNRTEYQNAVRDLLALDVDASALLPPDSSSHGFDNVTVADLSPTRLERYVGAAETISRLAVGGKLNAPRGDTIRVPADRTQEGHVEGLPLGTRGGTLFPYTFPLDGDYEIQIWLTRDRDEHVEGLREPHELELLVDRERAATFRVEPPQDDDHSKVDAHLKVRIPVRAGPRRIGVTFVESSSALVESRRQPYQARFNRHRHARRTPAIFQVSITGPFGAKGSGDTPSRRRVFACRPETPSEADDCARRILSTLARRAYRRPVNDELLAQPLQFYREGSLDGGFDAGIQLALSSILVSPRFLFRIEQAPPGTAPGETYPVSDIDLASRLSFFLWSSIPDDALLELAESGRLRDAEVFEREVRRMLADPRSRSLVDNFASQWLHLRNLDSTKPDQRLFPSFDDNLRTALRRETELFVRDVFLGDQSVLELLRSRHTYLNGRLAKHYGIPHVHGSRFRRVALAEDNPRGGLLRHGSILTVTSYATRTSPVIRGHWILENLLGSPPPPPPPDVPALEEQTVSADLPLRERLLEHRANPACASCHEMMDPIGFALENFDAVGRWRDLDAEAPIDATGRAPGGGEFQGVAGLEESLLDRPEIFVRTLVEKLLTFALGRGVEYYDAPAVREIVRAARKGNYRFSSLVLGIAKSTPFQMRLAR